MPPLRRGEETAGAPINASTSQCIIHHSLHRCLSVSHYLPLREYMAHWKPTTPWHHRQYHHHHHHKHHHAAHSPPSALDGTPTLPTSLPPYLPTSLPPYLHSIPHPPHLSLCGAFQTRTKPTLRTISRGGRRRRRAHSVGVDAIRRRDIASPERRGRCRRGSRVVGHWSLCSLHALRAPLQVGGRGRGSRRARR